MKLTITYNAGPSPLSPGGEEEGKRSLELARQVDKALTAALLALGLRGGVRILTDREDVVVVAEWYVAHEFDDERGSVFIQMEN